MDTEFLKSLASIAPPKRDTLTHSRLACFRSCPRKHQIRYEFGITPVVDSFALRVGSAFHAALEARDKGLDPEAAIGERVEDPYDLALVAAMFDAHERHYAKSPVETVASEQVFEMPLRNPETGAATPNWVLKGVIDRIVRLPDGRLALMENKTTSRDFSPGADYWVRLQLDQQLSIYLMAARHLGHKIDTILYDVTKRPGQRPLKATPEEKRTYKKDGTLYANQRDKDETPEEYAARVAAAIAEEPDKFFARIEIARLDQDLEECAKAVWDQQIAIRQAQKSGAWYRNPEACFSAGGFTCEYLPICQNRDLDTTTPADYQRLKDAHPELAAHAESGG